MNKKLVLECKNSDGLTGFNYSHAGYWKAYVYFGQTTSLECANACMQGCVAIEVFATASMAQKCYHYKNKEDITDANKVPDNDGIHSKAYIKC